MIVERESRINGGLVRFRVFSNGSRIGSDTSAQPARGAVYMSSHDGEQRRVTLPPDELPTDYHALNDVPVATLRSWWREGERVGAAAARDS